MISSCDVQAWRLRLRDDERPDGHEPDADSERVELIAHLERLKATAAAVQAALAVELDASTRAREAEQGVPAARCGRGVAAQVALARAESPHRGQQLLGLARDLLRDLPVTYQALREGRLSEFRAQVVARETGCLEAEDRARVEAEVVGDPDAVNWGTRELAGRMRSAVAGADPAAVVRRHRRAENDRCVSVRPAPDTMAYLTALLPIPAAVACQAALARDAAGLIGIGAAQGRSTGQVVADLLVERLTGQVHAEAVPVCVDLVISDRSLLAAGHEPAVIPGWGPVPAEIARHLVGTALTHDAETDESRCPVWLRRLYTRDGRLVGLSSRSRFAPDGLADWVLLRDQGLCRTPWCDAPIAHRDHVVPAAEGGPTSGENLQGLCAACNHAAQAPGWRRQVLEDPGRHRVEVRTPTGHRYTSQAPAPPEPAGERSSPTDNGSRLELSVRRYLVEYVAA